MGDCHCQCLLDSVDICQAVHDYICCAALNINRLPGIPVLVRDLLPLSGQRILMETHQNDYFAAYRSVKLTRDAKGVLVVEFHSNGGPLIFTAQDHTEFVDAFYRISQDRANKIVILTGAGADFIPSIDFSSFGNVADPEIWSHVSR
jgi:hypothetical protein